MKTESTEALAKQAVKKIIDSLIFEINYEEDNYDAGYSAALHNHGEALYMMGFSEGQSNPKIKQLEWVDNFKETRWHCDLPIGFYIIDTVRKYEPYRVRFYLSSFGYPKYERFCKTIEETMMYAQSHFETRVKECLITE